MMKAKFLGMGVLALGCIAGLGGLVMWLWNAVVPDLFAGAQSIDYLHALGLLVLCRILFGGFHGRGGRHAHRHWGHPGRWDAMTVEEREQLVRGRSCGWREGRSEGRGE